MNRLKTIYETVRLDLKIPNQSQRILYLSKVWGLQQLDIAEIEKMSQSKISMLLSITGETNSPLPAPHFDHVDLRALHELPREVLPDITLIAFVQDVLKLDSWHVFYQWYGTPSQRMAALHHLGMKNLRIAQIFGKTSGTVSMAVKRFYTKTINLERPKRYESFEHLTIKEQAYETKQTKGGF